MARTLRALKKSHAPVARRRGPRFDLVVANILEDPLCQLAPALTAALAPGGALLLSGFTPPQVPALPAALVRCGLIFVLQASQEGWCLLRLDRPATEPSGGMRGPASVPADTPGLSAPAGADPRAARPG